MRLKLDLNGIVVQVKINEYVPSNRKIWDDQWCYVDYSFTSGSWLNYVKKSDSVWLSCEVEELAKSLHKLLNDEIPERKIVDFIEPDFEFILQPKRDLRQDPQYSYVAEGHEWADIYADWTVKFWNDGLTDNFLSVTLGREDIEVLALYLDLVIGKISASSTEVQQLIASGLLSD